MSLYTDNSIKPKYSNKKGGMFEPMPALGSSDSTEHPQQIVSRKYKLLLELLSLDEAGIAQLEELLVEREKVLNFSAAGYFDDEMDILAAVARHQEMLASIDGKVGRMLSAEDYDFYELFKDSSLEQHQLSRYERSLDDRDALQCEQAVGLLLAKLKYKRTFLEAIDSSQQLAQAGDKKASRRYLERSINQYQRHYFNEAQRILSVDQFDKLVDFELNEFEDLYLGLLSPLD